MPEQLTAQQQQDDLLDLADVIGKRTISTRLHHNVTIREENAAAALEAMSRFAADPRWLIHLPPTMSPPATSSLPGLLEHPTEAFDYYRRQGVTALVCEEKHMGSRAILIVCRDEAAARERFGVAGGGGIVYTRTGRRFFDDPAMEAALLDRLRQAATAAGLWEQLSTGWLCLDCELMPWSAKAQELIRQQYAAVGAAASAALRDETLALSAAAERGLDVGGWAGRDHGASRTGGRFFRGLSTVLLACLLGGRSASRALPSAGLGAAHADKLHPWHLDVLGRLADGGCLMATPHVEVDLENPASESAAVEWWETLTGRGGEGMVVKPRDFLARGDRGLLQPAVKCRGREYLRIIYGPDYTLEPHLIRLRQRGLSAKRSLALREFALGIEALAPLCRRRSRSGASTSASSASSRWKASPWIHDSEKPHAGHLSSHRYRPASLIPTSRFPREMTSSSAKPRLS